MRKLIVALVVCVACSGADADGDDPAVATSDLAVNGTVLPSCADPGVTVDQGRYYVTCTGGGFPIYSSTSATSGFKQVGKIFPNGGPSWSDGNHWAPEIHHVGSGFVAYFTARNKANGKNAIGAARATSILGPYVDIGKPLVASTGSKIDAHFYTDPDSGKHYLFWKAELEPTDTIRGQEIAADGVTFVGGPAGSSATKTVLKTTEAWEGDVVEAPWVIKRGSFYYLFYSGNAYCNHTYGVGVARASHPLGPYTKLGHPILESGSHWSGPGHNAVVFKDGAWHTFFHAYRLAEGTPHCGDVSPDNNQRHLLSSQLFFQGGWPHVAAKL